MAKRAATDAELEDRPPLELVVPGRAVVTITCPNCGGDSTLDAAFGSRMTRDSDGKITLSLRTRAPKLSHHCDQLAMGLDAPTTGARVTG